MEKQYIFFNSAKALFVFFIGLITVFVLAGFLAYMGVSSLYLVGAILLLSSGLITWLCFWLDQN
jgi:hypothetical protein